MKYIQRISGCILLLLLSAHVYAQEGREFSSGFLEARLHIPSPSAIPPPEAERPIPFHVGERLEYSVGWGKVVNAGTALMEVKEIDKYQGKDVYRVTVKAKSNKVFSLFYRVRDTLESLIDVEGLFSRRYWTKQDEAHKKRERKYEFDQENNIAQYKGKQYYIRYGIQDEISAVFHVRTLDLHVGSPVYVDIFARNKNWQVKCEVLGIETISVPAGTFEAIVVEPELRFDGVMKKGKVRVWFSYDDQRIPVQVRSKIAIGSILIRLEKYQRGTELAGGN